MTLTSNLSISEQNLLKAQARAKRLFCEIENRKLITVGITEKELNNQIYELAQELFGIKKYWHKRVVRAGMNTLCPYRENPPNLVIQNNDLVFLDLGPVFEEWDADFGRTFLLGSDPKKQKMINNLEIVFQESKQFFKSNPNITGHQLFDDVVNRTRKYGYDYGGPHAGHLIGVFPHEKHLGDNPQNYICTKNNKPMRDPDINGKPRHWILEVHLINLEQKYGAFYEELLTIDK